MESSKENTQSSQKEVHIPERFLKREQERQQALEKRQEERQNKEGVGFGSTFNENFNQIKNQIQEMSNGDQVDESGKEELKEKFAEVNRQILLLNHAILDAKIFLASYDMKAYNSKLVELTEQCNALESKLLPRKKFGFRKVEKTKLNVVRDQGLDSDKLEEKDSVDFVKPHHEGEKNIGFYNRKNETLHLTSEEVNKKPIALSDIEDCTVRITGNASAVHMNNISKSTILLGPVSNSVHIENCTDSTLYLACHQFRMHTSDNCHLYLHCGSQPVIEYSRGIGFAPALNLDEELFKLSGLDRKNLWDHVQDFNWLSDEKSPNWFIIEESERENKTL